MKSDSHMSIYYDEMNRDEEDDD